MVYPLIDHIVLFLTSLCGTSKWKPGRARLRQRCHTSGRFHFIAYRDSLHAISAPPFTPMISPVMKLES